MNDFLNINDIPDFIANDFQKKAENIDKNILDNILNELKNYNVTDFINRLSSLNLIPYNQNKTIVFDAIINHILISKFNNMSDANIMSPKKFKQLVEAGMELNIVRGIDPIEMPFIQRIQFYGNKWIFSGINADPAYILQGFIDILFKGKPQFDSKFIQIANQITHFVLEVSTKIVERVQYTKQVFNHYETQNIVYPCSEDHAKLTQAIIFSEDEFDGLFNEEFKKNVYYDIDEKVESEDGNFAFYYKPFLKINSKQFIVLNPTMLVPFAIYKIIQFSEKYKCKDKIINLYNNKIWFECKESLKALNHRQLDTAQFGIELANSDCYKEALFNASNDGVLFVRYFCDNALKYNFANMFEIGTIDTRLFENRWKKVLESKKLVNKEKFYLLTIINSFGHGLCVPFTQKQYHKNLTLSPFELYCISINEQNHSNFLLHYIESKHRLGINNIELIPEINYLTLYVNNDYSFYISDDIDIKTNNIFPAFGDSVDYINKALTTYDKQLAEIPGSGHYEEIVLNESERNIYCSTNNANFTLMNRFKNLDVWVSTKNCESVEEANLTISVSDLITYWLSECKMIIEKNKFTTKTLLIKNHFTGDPEQYYLVSNVVEDNITNHLSSTIEEKTINIYWTPKAYLCLANKNNICEKEFVKWVLTQIFSFSESEACFFDFEDLFSNCLKRKIFVLDYTNNPYFKPLIGNIRHIPIELEHQLLDEIGDYLKSEQKYDYGVIQNIEKNLICNDIVGYLYRKLQSKVNEFNEAGFYELLHLDLEKIIYSMMITQKRYSYDATCYPEHIERLDLEYNEINKSSVATKFLLEYISAVPPSGEKVLGECDYEYMLTICSLIIEWANNSDMFLYKMIDNDLEILRSGRIGLKKDRIEELENSNYIASRKRLQAISNPLIDLYIPPTLVSTEELELAFEDEFAYTCTEFNSCVLELITIGDTIDGNVKRKNRSLTCELISEATSIPVEKVSKIIQDISLSRRKDYLNPPPPFNKNDVLPWKFNRRLSFIRRPVTLVNDDLIWGNRQLYHSLRYLFDLISSGRLPANEHGKLKSYLGKLINARGNDFNDIVTEKLKQFPMTIVDSKIKKINKKRLLDFNGNDLGDIDVLAILPDKKKIIVLEAKDFSFAKTPYEMHQQYLNVFCDAGEKLCYISRHKKRVEWIKNHITDVLTWYGLEQGKWKIVDALVVDETIVSNEFYHQNQNIILYSELTEESLKRIK